MGWFNHQLAYVLSRNLSLHTKGSLNHQLVPLSRRIPKEPVYIYVLKFTVKYSKIRGDKYTIHSYFQGYTLED